MAKLDHSTRQAIIDVARHKFMTIGYKDTSTRAIAQEVGITQPNLYHHFRNKQALYIAVLQQVGEETEDQLLNYSVNDKLSPEERLVNMTLYLRDNNPINIYAMLKDMESQLSKESRDILYTIFLTKYKQPFTDFFLSIEDDLIENYDAEVIASHYFMIIAPYISPDAFMHRALSIEKIIHLFIHGVIK